MMPINSEMTARTSRIWINPLGFAFPLKKNWKTQIITRITAIRYNIPRMINVFVVRKKTLPAISYAYSSAFFIKWLRVNYSPAPWVM
jgi:hypothetical protein